MTLIFTSEFLRLAFALYASFDAVELYKVEGFLIVYVKKCKAVRG
jgi:hypothetical protein